MRECVQGKEMHKSHISKKLSEGEITSFRESGITLEGDTI